MRSPILNELKAHAPFTLMGSCTGIVLLLAVLATKLNPARLGPAFESFHALHILVSAVVTAAMYRRYRKGLLPAVVIAYFGSVGIATISDVFFPHHGGAIILKLIGEHKPMHFHLPAVEEWWLINPVAFIGIAIGLWRCKTKIAHSIHILLSTWASLFYLVVNAPPGVNWLPLLPLVIAVLFVAVWLPCCFSDIVFPLLFVGKEAALHEHEHGPEEHAEHG